MPFKFRWPFSWPRRERQTNSASAPQAAANPAPAALPAAAPNAPAAVQMARALPPTPRDSPPSVDAGLPPEPAGPDIGQELLSRLPGLATPPTLGRLGGLPAMAQTLPTVERFLQKLPAPPPPPSLPGLGVSAAFAANLPSLAGFSEPGSTSRTPAFPAQLEPPSPLTDVLAPPGGMPGQIAGLSGAAAVLEQRWPDAAPLVINVTAPKEAPVAAPLPVVTPAQRATGPTTPAVPIGVAPLISSETTSIFNTRAVFEPAPPPLTHVLSPEQTLTGNILPAAAQPPIQRELLRTSGDEWTPPAEFIQPAQPAGERVSPAQRDSIESQRGQGRPIEPETRQRFEQAYGQPLDAVRVHTGPTAHATAESLNAIAFASGTDLFFTQNTYAPDSQQGLSLIGHELAHVIQQQYGVSGDADALRSPDDHYERQADQLSARALATPMLEGPDAPQVAVPGGSVQRVPADDSHPAGASPILGTARTFTQAPDLPAASAWMPGGPLHMSNASAASTQPLASVMPAGSRLPEDSPIQRQAASTTGTPAPTASGTPATPRPIGAQAPLTSNVPTGPRPSLDSAPLRATSLTEQLLNPTLMLTASSSLSQNLPGLGRVSDAGQGLPVFRRLSLPSFGGLPDVAHSLPDLGSAHLPDAGALTNQLPSLPGLPGGLPSLGDAAPAMPDLGGLKPPEMPLADGLGAASQAAGDAANGALAAGQQALGSITGAAPSAAAASGGDAGPATPPLPSLDKLTEHVWKEVQRKLKVERERSRGLA